VSGDREPHSLRPAAQLDPGLAGGECPSCSGPDHGNGPEARVGEVDAGLTFEPIELGTTKVERRVAGDPVPARTCEPEKSGISGLDGRPPAVEQGPLSKQRHHPFGRCPAPVGQLGVEPDSHPVVPAAGVGLDPRTAGSVERGHQAAKVAQREWPSGEVKLA
jgi:hypothetical protein